jgi:hypothetical protein
VTTLRDLLNDRLGTMPNLGSSIHVLTHNMTEVILDWLASTELAETLLLSDPARQRLSNGVFRTESIVVTLIQEAEK